MPNTLPSFQRLFLDWSPQIRSGTAHYAVPQALYRSIIREMKGSTHKEDFRAQVTENGGTINGAPLVAGERGKVLLLDPDAALEENLQAHEDVFVDALDCALESFPDLVIGRLHRLEKVVDFIEVTPATRGIVYDFPGTGAKDDKRLAHAGIYFFAEGVPFHYAVRNILEMYASKVQITLPLEAMAAFAHRASALRTHDDANVEQAAKAKRFFLDKKKSMAPAGA